MEWQRLHDRVSFFNFRIHVSNSRFVMEMVKEQEDGNFDTSAATSKKDTSRAIEYFTDVLSNVDTFEGNRTLFKFVEKETRVDVGISNKDKILEFVMEIAEVIVKLATGRGKQVTHRLLNLFISHTWC